MKKKTKTHGFPFKGTDTHAHTESMISKTNIMIRFDTLSESDTRREERAYRLAKELVKHELFPAER